MRLLEPVRLGRTTARNRLLFGPHETNLARRRAFSEAHTAYYRRRARGGCAVVVTETASVHPSDWPYERAPLAAECGPGWAAIAEAVHAEGALVLASLGHAGGQGSSAYSQQALWGPSRFPDAASREVPYPIGAGEIAELTRGFCDAAALAVASGCDGVEINAGQFSLLRQFLSGLTNARSDGYGSDRARLLREVLTAVRTALGDTAVLGLRLCCDELAPWAGITPEAAPALAEGLADGVDYIVAVRAAPFDVGGTRPGTHTEPGFARPLAAALRAVLPPGVAVVTQGSIVDPAMAEQAIGDGAADLVEMTRAQIADPDLAGKLAAGRPEQIRPCIRCNQSCMVRDARNPLVSCVGEPAAGHEIREPALDLPPGAGPSGLPPGVHRLDVLVVGAGPAGLEAARVAALAGHRVRLAERSERSGGAVLDAAAAHGRAPLAALTTWLAAECHRLGVTLQTGREVDGGQVRAHLADGGRVILATGSVPAAREGMLSARAVLHGADLPAGPVVIDDPVGGPVGISVAETLAADRAVELVTQDPVAGSQLARTGDLAPANSRLARAGVVIHRRSLLRAVRPGEVDLEDRYTGARTTRPAAVVIDAGPPQPDGGLAGTGGTLVGDAVAPRGVGEAVLEGRRAALALAGGR